MAFTFALEDLARERDLLDPERQTEELARTRRWLDEDDGGLFAQAAARLEAHPHPTASTWGGAGGLHRLAGDEAAARRCFETALGLARDPLHAAVLRWLLGERDVDVPRGTPLGKAVGALADGDAAAAVDGFAAILHHERVPPWWASGASDLHVYDWLELACEAEQGEPVTHAAMLERAGLLGATSGPAEVPDVLPPEGEWASPDGRLVVDDLGDVVLEAADARVELGWRAGRLHAEAAGTRLGPFDGFREAVDAAAAALREAGDEAAAEALPRVATLGFGA